MTQLLKQQQNWSTHRRTKTPEGSRLAGARLCCTNFTLPTGALDSKTGRVIMDIFHKLHEEQGKTIVLITHSGELANETERIITLRDGEITGIRKGELAC